MIQVTFGRTISKNFQSVNFTVQFATDKITFSRATALAMFIVKAKLSGSHTAQELVEFSNDYELVFEEPLSDYLKVKALPGA